MFVPVTTKPYINSVNSIILQQGVPAFFLSIKEKLINILLPAKNSNEEDFYNGKSSGI
jgi:hypothetical protein